jgi:hypothetical protein
VHQETGQLVMMLQEEIDFTSYFRCYCIGGKHVLIMPYNPRNDHQDRYNASFKVSKSVLAEIEQATLSLNRRLGYDFNTVEFAVRGDIPYAIDFCNPAPDADINSIGKKNFEWVVETAASYAIERAVAQQPDQDNLTWGSFVNGNIYKKTSTD